MKKREKCMCESCKIKRGESEFQIRARRMRMEAFLFSILRVLLGFSLGWLVAELLR